jgi:hypothetical protein
LDFLGDKMRAAIIGADGIVENVIVSENLEQAESFLPLLYPDKHNNYSVLDADKAKITGVGCRLIDGVWEEEFSIAVLGWDYIRVLRNNALGACDWTVLPDNQLSNVDKEKWLVYRQELRDITTAFENPKEVIFPDLP